MVSYARVCGTVVAAYMASEFATLSLSLISYQNSYYAVTYLLQKIFQLIASWCHRGCVATEYLVKDCQIIVANQVNEPLQIEYQEKLHLRASFASEYDFKKLNKGGKASF